MNQQIKETQIETLKGLYKAIDDYLVNEILFVDTYNKPMPMENRFRTARDKFTWRLSDAEYDRPPRLREDKRSRDTRHRDYVFTIALQLFNKYRNEYDNIPDLPRKTENSWNDLCTCMNWLDELDKIINNNQEIPNTEVIHIQLDDFSETPSKKLLKDLLFDINRNGVKLDESKHGKDQPNTLKKALREHDLKEFASNITKRKDVIKLLIPKNNINVT